MADVIHITLPDGVDKLDILSKVGECRNHRLNNGKDKHIITLTFTKVEYETEVLPNDTILIYYKNNIAVDGPKYIVDDDIESLTFGDSTIVSEDWWDAVEIEREVDVDFVELGKKQLGEVIRELGAKSLKCLAKYHAGVAFNSIVEKSLSTAPSLSGGKIN